jgi:hypothetical protein
MLVPVICIKKNNLQHENLFKEIHNNTVRSYENFFFIIYTFTITPKNKLYGMIIKSLN